jgi:hypothetical protein
MRSSRSIISFHILFVLTGVLLEWSNDIIEILISQYRKIKCLSNWTDSFYKLRSQKNDAWKEIGQLLGYEESEDKKKKLLTPVIVQA